MIVTPLHSGLSAISDPSVPRNTATAHFRQLIPSPDHPRVSGIGQHTAISWCESRRHIEGPAWLIERLQKSNIEKPYVGFSSDGRPDQSLIRYQSDEGAPVSLAVHAARRFLSYVGDKDKAAVIRGDILDDDEFRAWSNPELYVNPGGIRLDETDADTRSHIHDILRASLSEEGFTKVRDCTFTNHFLGGLVGGHAVLNEDSYNFRLFLPAATRQPSMVDPWGFTFFGHHLCLAVCFVGTRMVIGPTFMGAEPDQIDEGPRAGLRLFVQERTKGLELMQMLSASNQKRAQLFEGMNPREGLPPDRWNPFDERHLGGAHQDNRVVPFEGLPVCDMTASQRELLYLIVEEFNIYLPREARKYKMDRVRAFEGQTYFSWIGKYGPDDPYYYRIHSPVVFCEFDFHCGIFLTNTSPAKCHIHTVNRLPNGEDYGKALIRQWRLETAGDWK